MLRAMKHTPFIKNHLTLLITVVYILLAASCGGDTDREGNDRTGYPEQFTISKADLKDKIRWKNPAEGYRVDLNRVIVYDSEPFRSNI